ncbi:unnamed protein product [Pieris macdunnoughi]|uniref:Uncharacterized protein n=1 Tax=Pieris macdunnoughi TaxID=345717 RepID=A0A821X8C8_9NEOP|nr:unnamed protein product [Pieris macdunnoughi]
MADKETQSPKSGEDAKPKDEAPTADNEKKLNNQDGIIDTPVKCPSGYAKDQEGKCQMSDEQVQQVEMTEEEPKVEEAGDSENATEPTNSVFTNVVVTPPNCPKGFQRGADGVCREVF